MRLWAINSYNYILLNYNARQSVGRAEKFNHRLTIANWLTVRHRWPKSGESNTRRCS